MTTLQRQHRTHADAPKRRHRRHGAAQRGRRRRCRPESRRQTSQRSARRLTDAARRRVGGGGGRRRRVAEVGPQRSARHDEPRIARAQRVPRVDAEQRQERRRRRRGAPVDNQQVSLAEQAAQARDVQLAAAQRGARESLSPPVPARPRPNLASVGTLCLPRCRWRDRWRACARSGSACAARCNSNLCTAAPRSAHSEPHALATTPPSSITRTSHCAQQAACQSARRPLLPSFVVANQRAFDAHCGAQRRLQRVAASAFGRRQRGGRMARRPTDARNAVVVGAVAARAQAQRSPAAHGRRAPDLRRAARWPALRTARQTHGHGDPARHVGHVGQRRREHSRRLTSKRGREREGARVSACGVHMAFAPSNLKVRQRGSGFQIAGQRCARRRRHASQQQRATTTQRDARAPQKSAMRQCGTRFSIRRCSMSTNGRAANAGTNCARVVVVRRRQSSSDSTTGRATTPRRARAARRWRAAAARAAAPRRRRVRRRARGRAPTAQTARRTAQRRRSPAGAAERAPRSRATRGRW